MNHTPVYTTKLVRNGIVKTQPKADSTDRAKLVAIEYLKDSPCEQLIAIALDTKNKVIGMYVITQGTLDSSLCHPREAFRPAILLNASSIIIAHNHPSGELEPSREDYRVFDHLQNAGDLIGIHVHDSIIVNDEEALSMLEEARCRKVIA